ncbi:MULTISPECIES: excinuclease ABC subunit UvrA [Curtobacterium]|jgi:excinuclease ABC subunit A|uniref:UvrABC system protein A n=1 Tax=Curtobacterium poinsettiae TaxID=159612 RepID=A0ABT3S5H1_9MICO|nr:MULTISPECIES: excinuclease ABC subunit UvrA [Curtobacterium]MBT1610061.1 excinuclease ABC subunit UvrA [Curtobacterium flaccumfaciens pv. poinsettiae]MCU0115458.1 excinuclease ABC subunit UvrA [Curtobacterium flaccumfaciens]MCX2850061.1 excinuclease ABC subunit UvrA [Curtobacterium flaccumfaciens pv. poinsettiae]UXN19662.1 excinuclease ABC subunit UvrA [Curtobacterium flaccumfaciens pv. poinsettiae]VXB55791.1 UvrABC system protein A [Curtobacterium sp. 8I-2]
MPAPRSTKTDDRPGPDDFIRVRGARENNLRDVDVDIPRDRIVAFTGVSGSGKSSLAFGTVFAEAQRRFLESVAPYARRLIAQGSTPHVDSITGLPPAVALQQRRGAPSSRSTVGTMTTLSNSMRMLYSRAGTYPSGADRLESDSFSPNTVAGACPRCHGIGTAHEVTEASAVHDPSLSIRDGAITAWPGAWQGKNLRDVTAVLGYDIERPWRELSREDRDWLLFTEEQPVVQVQPKRDRVAKPYKGRFWSARQFVLHTLADSQSETQRKKVLQFVESGPCGLCGGTGLTRAALAVTIGGHSIAELNALPLTGLADVLRPIASITDAAAATSRASSGEHTEVAVAISRDLLTRVDVLVGLGLGYLALDRATPTLSPGESQRLRIATQLRSGLFGVVYVLDEPSAGLHPADAESLVDVLDDLRAGGNSVFVVEHDMSIVRRADWIVDVGPRAGSGGGTVLYSGPVAGLAEVEASVTRRFLEPRQPTVDRAVRAPIGTLELRDLTLHNLRGLDVDLPLGVLTAVTGVSGSGKSSLVGGVLPGAATSHPIIDRVVQVDQKPIGRTPRSNLATYTGLFDAVRAAFAQTDEAKARGWGAGRFSFNVAGGRCEVCQGEGSVSVELLFLPGSWAPCPECHGSRYTAETLEVRWNGASIADVLGMTVDEAAPFLAPLPAAGRGLETLREVGLGYLRLGQPAPELSGGEAQRIKLATELQRARTGHTLYLLDEPTTGLHPADVELLTAQLARLTDTGNTVVVVEHAMDVVASADHVIDMGPSGGVEGGQVVASGTPAEVAASTTSRTAPYLRDQLGR